LGKHIRIQKWGIRSVKTLKNEVEWGSGQEKKRMQRKKKRKGSKKKNFTKSGKKIRGGDAG